MRREEGDRRVAPVVDSARGAILSVELKDRQQFDRGDTQLLEIRNLLDHAGIRAAFRLRHSGTGMAGEAAHVHFVNDGLRGGPVQGRIAFPIVAARIRHDALHGGGGVVAGLFGRRATVLRGHDHAAAVGIQQHLGRVKPHAARRLGRPMHAIAVQLPRLHARHERVPVVVRAVAARIQRDAPAGSGVIRTIKEHQLHA